ncbi:MAG TPA: TonB-dependent receptor, partial [Chthoniobacterales bacterium]|nr:TonB-dependent receptor [Chthoniobacterales bacterium]
LAPFTTIDAAIFYNLSDAVTAGVKVENLFDTEIETGKSADGLVSIGAPRLMMLQLRWKL